MSSGTCCHGKPKKGGLHLIKEMNIRPIKEGLTKLRYIVPSKKCGEDDPKKKNILPGMGSCPGSETDLPPPPPPPEPEPIVVLPYPTECCGPPPVSCSKTQSVASTEDKGNVPCDKSNKLSNSNSTGCNASSASSAPPANKGCNTPSANKGCNAPSANKGCNAPPANKGCNAPPANKGCNAPPANKGCNAPPANKGCNAPPANKGCNAPPANKDGNTQLANKGDVQPANTGCNAPPANTDCNAPPANTGGNAPPANTGCNAPPANTGCNAPPANKGCNAPPANKGCNAPPANNGCAPPANNGCAPPANENKCTNDANEPDFDNLAVLQNYTDSLKKANGVTYECQAPGDNELNKMEEGFYGPEILNNNINNNEFANANAADYQFNVSPYQMSPNNMPMIDFNTGNYPMNMFRDPGMNNLNNPQLNNFNQPFYNFEAINQNPANQLYQMPYANDANMNSPMMPNYFNNAPAMNTNYGTGYEPIPYNGINNTYNTDNQQQFNHQVMNNYETSDDGSDVIRIQIYPPKICITFIDDTANKKC